MAIILGNHLAMWYYSKDNEKLGPVDEAQFKSLIAERNITGETLVWREGMPDWQPLSALNLGLGEVAVEQHSIQLACSSCGQSYGEHELLRLGENQICAECKPVYEQRLKEGLSPIVGGGKGVWKDGKKVMMEIDAELPDRCIKCNGPSEGPHWKKKLVYNHPAIYLLILINLLILIIVSLFTAKKATVFVPLCENHRSAVKKSIALACALFVGGVVLIVVGVGYEQLNVLIGVGALSILSSFIVGLVKGRLVVPTKIDKEHVWMKGFCKEYLNDLPQR